MSQCWPLEMPPTQKSVLISLADNANDHGVCWPSIPTIAKRTCFSERAVQNAIKWLERYRLLMADRSNGRHTSYTLTPGSYLMATPDADAPVQQVRGRRKCAGAGDAPTTAADSGVPPQEIPKPPHQVPSNRKEPSREPSRNRQGAPATSEKIPTPFERFWAAWPKSQRKVGKVDCERRWKRAGLDAAVDKILAHVEAMKGTQQWREGFEPAPSTYLNQQRWNDEVPADQPKTAGSVPGSAATANWWETATGVEQKGTELGVQKKPGEEFWRYRVRVFKRAGDGKWRQDLLADMLRTKNSAYAGVHEFFYGHPPVDGGSL